MKQKREVVSNHVQLLLQHRAKIYMVAKIFQKRKKKEEKKKKCHYSATVKLFLVPRKLIFHFTVLNM
jgi:hypothetical protein